MYDLSMDKIEGLLKLFTGKYPPLDKCAHIFKLRQDGKDGLELVLNIEGKFYMFGFDPEDFMKTDKEILEKVAAILKSVMSPKVGTGVIGEMES